MNTGPAVVLMYHRLHRAGARWESAEGDYTLPAELFEDQVRGLAERGRPVVALEALPWALDRGAVLLTFDDGCESDVTVAAPLLRELGLPAAFFVNPGLVGTAGRASWSELRGLADEGFTVGSHGLDHMLLDGLGAAELHRQVVESKRRLEDGLGRSIDALSLPGGTGGERARRLALDAGYRYVLGSQPTPVSALGGILPRFAIRGRFGLPGFWDIVDRRPAALFRHALRYRLAHAARRFVGVGAYAGARRLWLAWTRSPRG